MTFRKPRRIRIKKQHEYYRDYEDEEYKKVRQEVLKRDNRQCQWPNCGAKEKLQTHHIRRWADNHSLRKDSLNLITLCRKCHDRIKNSEEYYQGSLSKIAYENHKKQQEKINGRSSSRCRSTPKNARGKSSETKIRTEEKSE